MLSQTIIKKLPAKRTTGSFKIDGNLNEPEWKTAKPANDFIEYRPLPGAKENVNNRTEAYILYDNTSIYFGGYCHEKSIDSISKELVGRDLIGSSDFIGIIFDTYNDKINGVGFYVTPYGEQYDAKYSSSGIEDDSWNAVWESDAKIQPDGWTFEMRIPYSALRFTSNENQTWGLNITRRRQKTGEQFMWNKVDPNKSGFIKQEGEWTGIEKIISPLRLSFSPYFSTYLNHYPYNIEGVNNFTSSVNGGMDVKYGISQSFTLDMTLIPDFGQVQSDNQVLNLSPFEVKYNENRSFFTEGTELFNKGDLFYSRRIGGMPLHHDDVSQQLDSNEHLLNNPTESKLINATKISGRTHKGLGIGFFNGITKAMYATVEDDQGNKRKIQTNPLTNYNIIVLDQTLKHNSSVSFVNTNVLREGEDYDADVAAALFDLYDKKSVYNWYGKISASHITGLNEKSVDGYSHNIGFAKTSGIFNFNFYQELTDNKYDPNDLGILFNNNYLEHFLQVRFKWLKPGKWYNNIFLNNNFTYSRRLVPTSYQYFHYNINANSQLKNLWTVGLYAGYNARSNDFYESRVANRIYKSPQQTTFESWVFSNEIRRYSFNVDLTFGFIDLFSGKSHSFTLGNNFRFSDKFSIGQTITCSYEHNNVGYAVTDANNDIIFSRRDRNTVENIINLKYNFDKNNGITFRARHYWSFVDAKEPLTLQPDGSLLKNDMFMRNIDQNLNLFNIDMVYTWQFAPGSFVNVVYKNAIVNGDETIDRSYLKNFNHTIIAPQNNNFSIKVIYYLDYLTLKKKK